MSQFKNMAALREITKPNTPECARQYRSTRMDVVYKSATKILRAQVQASSEITFSSLKINFSDDIFG
jgi:hypothetical protein